MFYLVWLLSFIKKNQKGGGEKKSSPRSVNAVLENAQDISINQLQYESSVADTKQGTDKMSHFRVELDYHRPPHVGVFNNKAGASFNEVSEDFHEIDRKPLCAILFAC